MRDLVNEFVDEIGYIFIEQQLMIILLDFYADIVEQSTVIHLMDDVKITPNLLDAFNTKINMQSIDPLIAYGVTEHIKLRLDDKCVKQIEDMRAVKFDNFIGGDITITYLIQYNYDYKNDNPTKLLFDSLIKIHQICVDDSKQMMNETHKAFLNAKIKLTLDEKILNKLQMINS